MSQHYQALVTQPVLLEQLWDYGVDISSGQLHGILTANKDPFHQEKAEVLAAGLTTATYIGTDDTGARHQGQNGYTTAIGNDLFAYFETTDCKSRLNFLHVLQGELRTYVIEETTWVYWNQQGLPEALVNNLKKGPLEFAGEEPGTHTWPSWASAANDTCASPPRGRCWVASSTVACRRI